MATRYSRNVPLIFYGYIIILVSGIIAVVVEGLFFSFGVFFEPLLLEFGWTRAMTSGVFSLQDAERIGNIAFGKTANR